LLSVVGKVLFNREDAAVRISANSVGPYPLSFDDGFALRSPGL